MLALSFNAHPRTRRKVKAYIPGELLPSRSLSYLAALEEASHHDMLGCKHVLIFHAGPGEYSVHCDNVKTALVVAWTDEGAT